jgi:thiol-disulfide isomerase/thioredoxin
VSGSDLWFVDYYSPDCAPCKDLEPIIQQASTELRGELCPSHAVA